MSRHANLALNLSGRIRQPPVSIIAIGRQRQAGHMEKRQRAIKAIGPGMIGRLAAAARIPAAGRDHVLIRQNAALRARCRTRGVEQRGLGIASGVSGERRRTSGRRNPQHARSQIVPRHRKQGDGFRQRLQQFLLIVQRDDQVGFGVSDQIFDLGRAIGRINRNDRDADGIERQPVNDEIGPVFQQQACAMPMPESRCTISIAQGADLPADFAVGQLDAVGEIGVIMTLGNAQKGPERRGVRGRRKHAEHGVHRGGGFPRMVAGPCQRCRSAGSASLSALPRHGGKSLRGSYKPG